MKVTVSVSNKVATEWRFTVGVSNKVASKWEHTESGRTLSKHEVGSPSPALHNANVSPWPLETSLHACALKSLLTSISSQAPVVFWDIRATSESPLHVEPS